MGLAGSVVTDQDHGFGAVDIAALRQFALGLPGPMRPGQADLQQLLLTYLSDAVRGFVDDLGRQAAIWAT